MTEQYELAVAELAKKQIHISLVRELKSGKEAQVFVVADDSNNELYALKLYHDYKTRTFQTQKHYFEDRYVGSGKASIRRAIKKGNDVGRGFVQSTWVMREQYFLKKISGQTPYIPKFIQALNQGVLMEYIGTSSEPAPRLSEVKLEESLKQQTVEILLDLVDLFLQNGIIHGDLSPFNILWWNNVPIVIDFPQAVDVRESKRLYSLLRRDVQNVMKPFGYPQEVIERITLELLDRHRLPLFDTIGNDSSNSAFSPS